MNAKFQGWYDLNAGRAYPLDDRATHEADDGSSLPQDLLLDASIRFPEELGSYLFLGSISVSENLWSAAFLACDSIDSPPGEFVPVAAVYRAASWQIGDTCAVEPLYPGVRGWIAIGGEETYRGKFSTPAQGLLLPRAARPYTPLGLSSVSKEGAATRLSGTVLLRGGNDIEIVSAERQIYGRSHRVVVFRLKSPSGGRNPLEVYKGPCGGRPESGTCSTPAVEFLNEVGPDCNGNIQLVIPDAVDVIPFQDGGGLELNYPLGLSDACTNKNNLPDAQGRLPGDPDDTCTPQYEGYQSSSTPPNGGSPTVLDIPGVAVPDPFPPGLPYEEDFDDGLADGWDVLYGSFSIVPGDAAQTSGSSGTGTMAYAASDPVARSVSILNNYCYPETTSKRVITQVRINTGGARASAGLVLNYHTVIRSVAVDEYVSAEANVETGSLVVLLRSGGSSVTLGSVGGLDLRYRDWYELTAVISAPDVNDRVIIAASLFGLTREGVSATISLATYQYVPGDGRFGVGSDGTLADFAAFRVEEA